MQWYHMVAFEQIPGRAANDDFAKDVGTPNRERNCLVANDLYALLNR
jgi:hypothetical protein